MAGTDVAHDGWRAMRDRYVTALELEALKIGARYRSGFDVWVKRASGNWGPLDGIGPERSTHQMRLFGEVLEPELPGPGDPLPCQELDVCAAEGEPGLLSSRAPSGARDTSPLEGATPESPVATGTELPQGEGNPVSAATRLHVSARDDCAVTDSCGPRSRRREEISATPIDMSDEPRTMAVSAKRQAIRAWFELALHVVLVVLITLVVLAPTARVEVEWSVAAYFTAFGLAARIWALDGRLNGALGLRPPLAPPPDPPDGLKRPELALPPAPSPRLDLPGEPPKTIRGGWTNCNVCGRPLTDGVSRYRGVGPTCLERTGIHYPDGPPNPAHEAWLEKVDELRRAHELQMRTLEAEHQVAAVRAREAHRKAVEAWECDVQGRARLQELHDERLRAWTEENARRRDSWLQDPRQALANPLHHAVRLSTGWAILLLPAAWLLSVR